MNHKCGTISDGTREFECNNNAEYWITAVSRRKYYYCKEHLGKTQDINHIGSINLIETQKNITLKFEQKGEITANQIKKAIATIASSFLPKFIVLSENEREKELESPKTRQEIRKILHQNDKFFPDLRQDIKQYEEWAIEEIEAQLKQKQSGMKSIYGIPVYEPPFEPQMQPDGHWEIPTETRYV